MDLRLQSAHSDFALYLYKSVAKSKNGNVFLSTHSASIALYIMLVGSKEKTAKQLKDALEFSDIDESVLHETNAKVIKEISHVRNVSLAYGIGIFHAKGWSIYKEFAKRCSHFHGIKIEALNFNQKLEKSRLHINEWAEKQTRNKISFILPNMSMNAEASIVLANPVTLKGEWDSPFNVDDTIDSDFHVNDAMTRKIKMMHIKFAFHVIYDPEMNTYVLELPYKGHDVSMVVILPNNRFGLEELEETLTAKTLRSWFHHLRTDEEVDLYLPQIQISSHVDLIPILKEMGVKDVFDKDKANLRGIMPTETGLCLSNAMQKTFIDIREGGCGVEPGRCRKRQEDATVTVNCDHPFMFVIKNNMTQSVLLMGRVADV